MKARSDTATPSAISSVTQRTGRGSNLPASDDQLLSEFTVMKSDEALTELMRRYRNRVFLIGVRILGDEHAAEDASQLTFLTLARKAGELSRNGSLNGWLSRTAELVARGMLRTRVRRARRETEAWSLKTSSGARWEPWKSVEPEVNAELESMPRALCTAVRMHYLEGLPQDHIAALAGCARTTISARISRAVARLRCALARRGHSVPVVEES